MKNPEVSVIMPVYQLSARAALAVKKVDKILNKLHYNYEIIVVDDGSTDDTYIHAARQQKPNIKVYRLPRNMGKGFALYHGYKKSSGDIVVFFDGDLDIDPRQIILLTETLRRNPDIDIAITSKWHPASKTRATPWRKTLSKTFNLLVRILLRINVSDTQTGAKAFRRRVLDDITPKLIVKRYAFDAELLALAVRRGYHIVEVPALWTINLTSRFSVREIARMLLDVVSVAYRLGVA